MSETLKKAKEHLSQITPGPWFADYEIDGVYHGRKTVVRQERGESYYDPSRIVSVGQTRRHVSKDGQAEKNVAFIADAPELTAKLLAAVETALETAEQLKQMGEIGQGPLNVYTLNIANRLRLNIEEALSE